MKHTVKVQQLMSDDNAYLNVIEDCGYVGVWTYPHDDGGVFVRMARTRDGKVALLAFGSLATAEEFEQNTVWTFVDIPEMDAECMENMRSSKIAREIVSELKLAGCMMTSTAESIIAAKMEPVRHALRLAWDGEACPPEMNCECPNCKEVSVAMELLEMSEEE